MKIESPELTEDDFHEIIGGYFERERQSLIERMGGIVEATEALATSLEGDQPSAGDDWNAMETLAHMATSAQFFGWVIYQAAKGNEIEAQMLELMRLRDQTIVDAAPLPAAELAGQVREAIERTIGFVGKVPYDQFRTTITFSGRKLSAEDFTRVSLIHHLEGHLEQMRAAIA